VTATENALTQRAYSAKELATLWGRSERTIQQLMARGDLPYFRVGRTRLVLAEDVKAYEKGART
jgi:excisionase family DNA binding protein